MPFSKFQFNDLKAKIFLFLWGLLLYSHTLSYDIIQFDDQILVVDNKFFYENIKNISLIFKTDVFMCNCTPFYRPLLNLSFMLNNLLNGPGFFVFHLTNILLHTFSGILLFLLLRKLQVKLISAFILSLIFLSHPITLPSAVWLPGRNDSLLFIFITISFLSFIKHIETQKIKYFLYSLIFFVFSIFTKETAVVLPVVLAFYAHLKKNKMKSTLIELIPFFIITLFFWIIRQNIIKNYTFPPFYDIKTSIKIFLFLISKTIIPSYPQIWQPMENINYYSGFIALFLILLLAIKTIKDKKENSIFGIIWYFLFILPFLILDLTPHRIGTWEQRLYIPLAGFLIFISGINWNYFKISNFTKTILTITLIIYLSASSYIYSFFFENDILFWEKVTLDFPDNAEANKNLADIYHMNKNYNSAEYYYKKTLNLDPKKKFIHHNLGIIYVKKNQKEKAQKEFQSELNINPDYEKFLQIKDKKDFKKLNESGFVFRLEK